MLEILKQYQLSEILAILIAFALGVKGLVTFYDWAFSRLKSIFNKENQEEIEKKKIQEKIDNYDIRLNEFSKSQESLKDGVDKLTNKINLLIDSDREDIKAFIVREHHYFCYQKKWIDDYSLECLEKRFEYYDVEGGNSFVENMMKEIRSLPKYPPNEDIKGE